MRIESHFIAWNCALGSVRVGNGVAECMDSGGDKKCIIGVLCIIRD